MIKQCFYLGRRFGAAWRLLSQLALGVAAGCAAVAASAQDIVLAPVQVGAHSWAVFGQAGMAGPDNRGFNSNAGFVVTPGGVVVLDTLGTPALGSALLAAIRRVTSQPVKLVILSHYHADHYYGAGPFKDAGAEVWAHEAGRGVTTSDEAKARLAQRRQDLFPWVDDATRLVDADRWLAFDARGVIDFELGAMRFALIDVSGAHSPQDIMLWAADDGVLFTGDLYFSGRLPFVVGADTRAWLRAIDRIAEVAPRVAVPGHGGASNDVARDLALTRDYLRYLREQMARGVEQMSDFEQVYDQVDWSAWEKLPAFGPSNRLNARSVYLELERESLAK
jgi:glyoxylase-like metal-dependent hydrolase (beta-lactamase superfamily II)